MDDRDLLRIAVNKAKESAQKGGFPAGAVLVKNGKVIAEGVSLGFLLHDPTSHAETATVRQACQKLNTSDLTGCTLYASLQPCIMCYCSANWARISKIVYGSRKTSELIEKEYYEGSHNIDTFNYQCTRRIDLEYISDFEEEMFKLLEDWENEIIVNKKTDH